MSLDQFPAEIETETRPCDTGSLRIVGPHEATKDEGLLVLRNADAGILHADTCHSCLLPNGDEHGSPLGTVLDGITDEIIEDLVDPSWVNLGFEHGLRGMHLQLMARRGLLQAGHHALNQGDNVRGNAL